MIVPLLRALRPQQWIKNLFVLAALIFSRHLFDPGYGARAGAAAGLFCLLSSAIYLLNDIFDRDSDRLHPEKKHRPIASGALPVPVAWGAAVLLVTGVLYAGFRLDPHFGWTALVYAGLNVAYSAALKHVVILDVMIVACGFLLRAVAGAFAIDVEISSWFILCTMLLSLFLGFVKRRQELILLEDGAANHRRILEEYDPKFLDQVIAVVTSGALVSYALYTMTPQVMEKLGTTRLNFTIPFVIYGLLRYLYLVYSKGKGGNPASTVLGDPPLILNGILWAATLVAVLYYL